MSYGDYVILDSLTRGAKVNFLPGQFKEQFERGLVTVGEEDRTTLRITDKGRTYVKKNKCPSFPACKVEKGEEVLYIC